RRRSLFPYARSKLGCIWKDARRKTGIDITPQVLREWFAEEMSNLGVPERYIDAFCGRVPRSVLARHYTDYRPDKLKMIYDRADLKVLS
ncbi:MAG: integrase, partial [Nitrososphaerota archaeon]